MKKFSVLIAQHAKGFDVIGVPSERPEDHFATIRKLTDAGGKAGGKTYTDAAVLHSSKGMIKKRKFTTHIKPSHQAPPKPKARK